MSQQDLKKIPIRFVIKRFMKQMVNLYIVILYELKAYNKVETTILFLVL